VTHSYRPDDAPTWKFVLVFGAVGAVLGAGGALLAHESIPTIGSAAVGGVVLFGGMTALIVAISQVSRLVVDGTDVIHRQFGRSQRAHGVGSGWRMISYYRHDAGGGSRFIRVLFDPSDEPRIMLNGAMWSVASLVRALGPLGVTVMEERRSVDSSAIKAMSSGQIAALSDEEAALIMKDTPDPTMPPIPRRVSRR
jgi:hypothetical protein